MAFAWLKSTKKYETFCWTTRHNLLGSANEIRSNVIGVNCQRPIRTHVINHNRWSKGASRVSPVGWCAILLHGTAKRVFPRRNGCLRSMPFHKSPRSHQDSHATSRRAASSRNLCRSLQKCFPCVLHRGKTRRPRCLAERSASSLDVPSGYERLQARLVPGFE